ncbi:hypothetical protein L1987_58102 [Smallanthus sonchifolius]|uniref:Uncharacterized protein n=1 Tax=Smallanthus sonchifolius TaxID=185202 RepID=A0ACB9DFD9_9ASTR|nr:hypothetical protein L1987_58102 [Smallanthus sonchifolius]
MSRYVSDDTVRSLVDLLPEITVVAADPFNSDPEDPESMGMKVVKAFDPGLLAKANRGILYVDEFNLLDDHLVDVLLDSAASGWTRLKEKVYQLETVRDAELWVKIVEERARFDKNLKDFRGTYKADQEKLQKEISSATSRLDSVQIDNDLRVKISKVCVEPNVDGLRRDIVTNRAAKALVALKRRDQVISEDIAVMILNCLTHKLWKHPLESIDSGLLVTEKLYEFFS